MPMHYKNIDRHGLKFMESEKVKAFDRLKIPVPLVFFTFAIIFLYTCKFIFASNSQFYCQLSIIMN